MLVCIVVFFQFRTLIFIIANLNFVFCFYFIAADSIFAPNQTVNLNELESEERDVESFKRFNYLFEPPKHKPKVNFNVKDIVVAKKNPSSDNTSPYFGELGSHSNTPHSEVDLLHNEMQGLQLTHGPTPIRPHATNASRYDNFLQGIIGDEIKTGPE